MMRRLALPLTTFATLMVHSLMEMIGFCPVHF
jgi:hypothetical protein